ncbi:MAG: hypothetical protein B7O98_05870 [Zestosphaera tikiterensis]|uniref:Lon proteolytic domain-containing protein n=1 Tax=Zestosphaera tikiterensis TaxID=1973259 RepID=A0A2R7Y3R0_9CREN|nr:MAG: hypothetical protein B7O98_05870 [Zestosphaera tikiterensis]
MKSYARSTFLIGYLMVFLVLSIGFLPVVYSSTCVLNVKELYLLAVSSSGGTYYGVPSELVVSLMPGSGDVYLSVEPLAELDMQASVKLAALISSYVSGIDYSNYSILVKIRSDAPIIGGPSAGGAITVALISLLTNMSLNKSVVMTGMILPDGLIGPVGGIPEKLEAAKSVGAKVMIIPAGQRMALSLRSGSYVDMYELGKKEGIRVVEASTIYDALKIFGYKVVRPQTTTINETTTITEYFKAWVNSSRADYLNLSNYVSNEVSNNRQTLSRGGVLNVVNNYVNKASEAVKTAEKEFDAGMYYAAASDYFGALVYLTTAKYIVDITLGKVKWDEILKTIKDEVNNATKYYLNVVTSLNREYINIVEVSLLAEIAGRVLEANDTLNSLPARQPTIDDVYSAAYTYWRAKSVYGWGNVYEVLKREGVNKEGLSMEKLKEGIQLLLSYATSALTYLQSLTGSSSVNLNTLLDRAENFLGSGKAEDLFYSLTLALKTATYASINTHLAFETNTSFLAYRLESAAEEFLRDALAAGFNPVVALSYYERGKVLRDVDSSTAAYYYDLAIMNSIWYVILSKSMLRKVSIEVSEQSTQTTVSSSTTINTVLSNYLALVAAIITGSLAGVALGYYLTSKRGHA